MVPRSPTRPLRWVGLLDLGGINMNLYEDLKWRGLIQDISDKENQLYPEHCILNHSR